MQQWTALFSRLSALWWDTTALTQQELTPELLERRKGRVIDLLQEQGEAEKYHAIFEYDLGGRMRDIKVKTLIVEVRVPDEAHLPALGPEIEQIIPDSSLVTLENPAGGVAVEAKAEELASIIVDYLRQVRL
jgi:hypothetical protein|tara:strand:- start:51 stop:446 length:396 start_codon:yes stop_codon:yes gene_type:complete